MLTTTPPCTRMDFYRAAKKTGGGWSSPGFPCFLLFDYLPAKAAGNDERHRCQQTQQIGQAGARLGRSIGNEVAASATTTNIANLVILMVTGSIPDPRRGHIAVEGRIRGTVVKPSLASCQQATGINTVGKTVKEPIPRACAT